MSKKNNRSNDRESTVRVSVRLPPHMDRAIDTAVKAGLWTDRSEFIRGAIRQQLYREFEEVNNESQR